MDTNDTDFEVAIVLSLLDETDQRRISILEILMQQQQWITIGELAHRVGASERTIHSDLVFFKNEWNDTLVFDVSLKNGIRLDSPSYATMRTLTIELFKHAIAPRFLRDLFLYPDQTMDYYANRLFVSNSTLLRLIPRINTYLSRVKASIERTGLGYRLSSADEQPLRKFLSLAYIELDHEPTHHQIEQSIPFNAAPIDFLSLREIVRAMLLHAGDSVSTELILQDPSVLSEMAAFYLISLMRENQGFHASSQVADTWLAPNELLFVKRLFPALTAEHLSPIHAMLTEPFLSIGTEASSLLSREIDAFYNRIFSRLHMSCPPQSREKLNRTLEILYRFSVVSPIRKTGLLRRINGFASSIHTCHPKLFFAFQESLATFSAQMQLYLSSTLPDLLLRACYIFPAFAMAVPTKRVLVFSSSGDEHARFIADFIRLVFCGEHFQTVEISPISYEDALAPNFDSRYPLADILITSDPTLLSLTTNKPILLFHDYPSTQNFEQLYNAIYFS